MNSIEFEDKRASKQVHISGNENISSVISVQLVHEFTTIYSTSFGNILNGMPFSSKYTNSSNH